MFSLTVYYSVVGECFLWGKIRTEFLTFFMLLYGIFWC